MNTQGYLIFAYNNQYIDYGTIALCNAFLIKRNCKINNVALVTSSWTLDYLYTKYSKKLLKTAWDEIIINDISDVDVSDRKFLDTRYSNFTTKYFNTNRSNAYNLSPFNETILLDADYLILDNTMDLVWNNEEPFMCNNKIIDLNHKQHTNGFSKRLNSMGIPLYWATVVYFKKEELSTIIFDNISYIKENYNFYKQLYNFTPSPFFRNDYSISIAIHIINKFVENSIKPLPIDYITISQDVDEIHDFIDGNLIITSEEEQGQFKMHRVLNNIHIMNKRAIIRNSKKIIDWALS